MHRYVGFGDADPDVRRMLERCARGAQRTGLRPEQLLVAMRDIYKARPGRADGAAPVDGDPELFRLIGMALDAYYAEQR
jgi:hypothetical protein